MATSDNLEYTELANGQVDQYLTVNEGMQVLDDGVAGRLTINFSSDANLTLSTTAGSEQWRDKFLTFTDTGGVLTTGRDVIFPAKNGPLYVVKNQTGETLTLKITGQPGVTVLSDSAALVYYDGTDMVNILEVNST